MLNPIYLVASGDLRLAANQTCWPEQEALEQALTAALRRFQAHVERAHRYDEAKRHGFIDSQRYGLDVFRSIPSDAPVIASRTWIT